MIKPLFIALAPIWLVSTLFFGIEHMTHSKSMMGIGMILTAAPLALFLAYILSFKKLARTSKNLYFMQFGSLTGLIICLISYFYQDHQFIQAIVLSTVSYLLTLLYIYWYSNNDRLINQQLNVGMTLPDFTISDAAGITITATEFKTKRTIFMFTRGNWCPLCMAQINEVVAAYQELDKLSVQVAIIASQPEKNTQFLANRFDVPFLFLIDEDQKLGKQLGLIHHNGLPFGFQVLGYQSDQYYPTIIATDENGIIIYSDQTSNYRVRPEPEEFIELFKNI